MHLQSQVAQGKKTEQQRTLEAAKRAQFSPQDAEAKAKLESYVMQLRDMVNCEYD